MDFKKTLLMACLFVGLNTVAQNRLEFNQVVTIDTSHTVTHGISSGYVYYGDYYYVPAGKVWKIESYCVNGSTSSILEINDVEISSRLHYAGSQSTQNVAVEPFRIPTWLKGGDKIRYKWTNNCQSGNCYFYASFFTSIIEFNIVTD